MLRAALLDMYNGEDNRGIPMLKGILNDYSSELTFSQFDVRVNHELPGLEFDIYLFSGGPGDAVGPTLIRPYLGTLGT
jgi:homoserine O-succinyltransferase